MTVVVLMKPSMAMPFVEILVLVFMLLDELPDIFFEGTGDNGAKNLSDVFVLGFGRYLQNDGSVL